MDPKNQQEVSDQKQLGDDIKEVFELIAELLTERKEEDRIFLCYNDDESAKTNFDERERLTEEEAESLRIALVGMNIVLPDSKLNSFVIDIIPKRVYTNVTTNSLNILCGSYTVEPNNYPTLSELSPSELEQYFNLHINRIKDIINNDSISINGFTHNVVSENQRVIPGDDENRVSELNDLNGRKKELFLKVMDNRFSSEPLLDKDLEFLTLVYRILQKRFIRE
jgi:hypothetical protein